MFSRFVTNTSKNISCKRCFSVTRPVQGEKPLIGFIGLGNMGNHMARNLVSKGYPVLVYDVNTAAVDGLKQAGAKTASNPAEIAANTDRIVTMLPASKHVQEVYTGNNGIFSKVVKGTIMLDSSTIDPAVSQDMAKVAEGKGAFYLDAPVSGGVNAAKQALLTFMVGGPDSKFPEAQEILQNMGKNVVHCGAVGTGQAAKICNNMLLGISMIGTSETMNLGIKLGLDPKMLAKILIEAEREEEFWEKKPSKTVTEQEILDQNQETDVSRIYDINLHAAELTVVPKLEKFPNLRVLDLSCNYIERIENLDQSRDIRELKLYDNRITTIENLKNLKELVTLQLQYNKLKQLGKGLTALTKLRTLRVDCNKILRLDAAELSCCVHLTSINISYNLVDSLSALNYLPNLEECYAAGNRIKTIELSRCKKLQDIDVSKNRITDLSGVKSLPNLQTLNISSNQIASLKPLGKSKSLQELYASGNRISDLSFIPDFFPRLEIFNISCNNIKTLDEVCVLERCEDIAELFLYENPFCAPGAEHSHYMGEVQAVIPHLEILDGAHIKRHTQRGAPLMRPMSASTIISVRQVETQMKAMDNEMASFEKNILDRFESLRSSCGLDVNSSPLSTRNPVPAPSLTSQRPSSKSSSRSKIRDALQFASQNLDDAA